MDILDVGNKQLLSVVKIFLDEPSLELSQIAVCKRAGLARMTVKKWLEFLVEESILAKRSIGPTNIYSLNKENAIVKQLKILNTLLQTRPILLALKEKYALRIFVYGSCARGDDIKDSDLDLLVIGKIDKAKLIPRVKQLEGKLGKPVRLNVYSIQEWAKSARADAAFYERVERDKIEIK